MLASSFQIARHFPPGIVTNLRCDALNRFSLNYFSSMLVAGFVRFHSFAVGILIIVVVPVVVIEVVTAVVTAVGIDIGIIIDLVR